MTNISVLVVDDHPVVTTGIEIIIGRESDFTMVANATNPQMAKELVNSLRPDIVILDLRLGGKDGIELIKRLQGISRTAKILVFSSGDELTYGVRSIKAGALGYLMKKEGLEELLVALKRVRQGKIYLSETLKSYLLKKTYCERHSTESLCHSEIEQLSNRELQILQYIGEGYTTGKISEALHISPKTISAHKENIKIKLGVDSSADLLRQAIAFSESEKI